jgi:hypothetical protein
MQKEINVLFGEILSCSAKSCIRNQFQKLSINGTEHFNDIPLTIRHITFIYKYFNLDNPQRSPDVLGEQVV